MLIEYNITFEKDGLTIKQRIDTNAPESQAAGVVFVEQKSLKASFQESKAANAFAPLSGGSVPSKKPGGGGDPGVLGTAPVTIIGPFIMCCPSADPKNGGKD